jgi:hypothetical protein
MMISSKSAKDLNSISNNRMQMNNYFNSQMQSNNLNRYDNMQVIGLSKDDHSKSLSK